MAEPEEEKKDFVRFELEEDGQPYGVLYVKRDIWNNRDPQKDELIFYVQDYGRFRLKIQDDGG